MADSFSPETAVPAAAESALRNLKARYFLAVDTRDWQALLALFTEDAQFDGFAFTTAGPRGFVAGVSEYLTGVQSVHHGFTPVFRARADGTVRGIWVMEDYLYWPPGSRGYKGISFDDQWGIHGFGHYEEEYRFEGGAWRISYMRLSRVRVEPLRGAGFPTPAYVVDALRPSWLAN